MPRYAALIYNGYWWSPERKMLQTMIDASQASVNGWVRVKLYKGNVIVVGRDAARDSLFDPAIATFEDDQGAYNQADAAGFIRASMRCACASPPTCARNVKIKLDFGRKGVTYVYLPRRPNTFCAIPVAAPTGSLRIARSRSAIMRKSPSSAFSVT